MISRFELGEDDDIAKEDSDAQLADMRCPITQKPLVRAAYAQVYFVIDILLSFYSPGLGDCRRTVVNFSKS